jgi:glycosyltransferase involved in cell wall biosynthesis
MNMQDSSSSVASDSRLGGDGRVLSEAAPRLSIGVPVYNGERYLAQTLQAILSQSYGDFELIVSDNASTDRTEDIVKSFMANDGRIRYYRSERNLGVAQNYNRTVRLARGEFFKWATYDDMIAPENLRKCIEVLERDPTVVLCYPKTIDIDDDGKVLGNYEDNFAFLASQPHRRFRDLMRVVGDYACNAEQGIVRREVLLRTGMEADYHSADKVLLAELVLHGKIYEVPERLFYHRLHSATSTAMKKTADEWAQWFNPANAGKRTYPKLRRLLEFFRAINRAPLTLAQRLYCYVQVARFYLSPDKYKRLWRDITERFRRRSNNTHAQTEDVV